MQPLTPTKTIALVPIINENTGLHPTLQEKSSNSQVKHPIPNRGCMTWHSAFQNWTLQEPPTKLIVGKILIQHSISWLSQRSSKYEPKFSSIYVFDFGMFCSLRTAEKLLYENENHLNAGTAGTVIRKRTWHLMQIILTYHRNVLGIWYDCFYLFHTKSVTKIRSKPTWFSVPFYTQNTSKLTALRLQ